MTKEEQILKEYEKILTYKYIKANTKSKKKRILYDLCVLSELFTIYPNINKILPWEQDRTILSLLEEYNIEFSHYVVDNKKIFNTSFNNILNIFKEIDFPFYNGYLKTFKRIPQNITNEIIFSFLEEFDEELLKKYRGLLADGKIFKTEQKLNASYIFSLPTLNENLILPINNISNNIYTSSILVHELGHLYETNMYNITGNYKAMHMINKLPYYEVISRFLEYTYLNYLKDNNIYFEETEMAIHNYYIDLFINACNISTIYKMKNISIDEDDCVEIEEPLVIDYANSLMNKFNIHSLETVEGDFIGFRDSFIYGIGDIFSFYLYENYKQNPREFKKELANALLTYPYTKDIKPFEIIGVTEEKLTSKKELRRILTRQRMEYMTIEELVLDYEKKLNEIYARANTKSKRKRIAADLFTFSNICAEHFGIDKTFEWEKDIKIIEEIKNYYEPFISHISDNNHLYNHIFTSVLNTFVNHSYNIYNYYNKPYQELTEKEKQELLFDFLADFDESLLKDFEAKLSSQEIFLGDIAGYGGLTYPIGCLNKTLIFCSPDRYYTVFGAQILAHEFGHCYEMKSFYETGQNSYLDSAYTKPYYEISSRFFEYAFLKYLEEHKILINDTNKSLDYMMFDLLSRAYNIYLMNQMSSITIEEMDNVYITEKHIIDTATTIQNQLNYHLFPGEEGDIIKFRHSFIYGIGDLFGIYLYENYKEDPNNFKKEFRNALLSYPYGESIKEFERVGVTSEILAEGKVLKRILDSMK